MASVGYATLDIIPSMRGVQAHLERGLAVPMLAAGRKSGDHIATGMGESVKRRGRGIGGSLATHLGVGFAAIGVGSIVKSSVQLEAAFSKTLSQIAVATGAPKSAIKGLHDEALKMGAATKYSANQAADAMLELGKSGISTRDIMGGGIKGTLTLAAAGDLELGSAATIASNAMNTFNLRGKDMAKIAAALAGGANASTASVESLGQALSQVGPGAKNAGLSLQETVGTLAAFDQAGIKGSDAGTSLKTFLARLVPQTKAAKDAMEAYGLASYNAGQAQKLLAKGGTKMSLGALKDQDAANHAIQLMLVAQGDLDKSRVDKSVGIKAASNFMWQNGVMDSAFTNAKGNFEKIGKVSDALKAKLSGLSESERTTALTTIFGSDATRAATVLMEDGSKGLGKYIKATKDQGAAQKMAKANMSGTAGALERLSGAVETAKLKLGEALAPTVRKLADYLSTTAVPALTDFVDQMQSGTGTGGAVKRDLETIYDAAKKVVEIGGKVASAFDGLPDGLKKAIAVGGIGALLASRVPGAGALTKGITGGAVKSITSGIQKVFVVNMAEGGVGGGPGLLGGKGGKGKGGKLGRFGGSGFTKGNLAMFAALEIGSLVIGGGKGAGSKIGAGALQGAALGSYFGAPGAAVGAVAGGLTADALRRRYVSNKPDKSYAATMSQENPKVKDLAKTYGLLYAQQQKIKAGNPDHFKTMLDIPGPIRENADKMRLIMEKLVETTGLSSKKLREGMLGVNKPAHDAALDFEELRLEAQKAHIGTRRLGKMLGSLPPAVVTKILTPGALTSHKAIVNLGKQFGLTPKQIKTIIKLVGARDAQDDTKKTRNGLRILNQTSAKPHVEIQGVKEARAAARSVRRSLAAIHDVHAKIAINTETDQFASKRDAMRHATGGWITGPGSGTSDSIPALLSNGEFVVNAASAQRYRRELEAMNVQRFANGGSVGGGSVPSVRGGQEIRGTLSIDRDGVAYIHGVSRDEVHHHAAAKQASDRAAAMSL